ncbi:MAG: hypothetical protein LCH80_07465 [Proteobacteria bacterium]|nr:hypothetical protein [Pseudomonadota bacterium]
MTNLTNSSSLSALVARTAEAVRSVLHAAISAANHAWSFCRLSEQARTVALVRHFETHYETCRLVAYSVDPTAVAISLAQLDPATPEGLSMPAVRISLDHACDPRFGFSEETIRALAAGEIVSLPGKNDDFHPYSWLGQLRHEGLAALFPGEAFEIVMRLADEVEGRPVEPNLMLDTRVKAWKILMPLFRLARRIALGREGCLVMYNPALVWPLKLIPLSLRDILVWPERSKADHS